MTSLVSIGLTITTLVFPDLTITSLVFVGLSITPLVFCQFYHSPIPSEIGLSFMQTSRTMGSQRNMPLIYTRAYWTCSLTCLLFIINSECLYSHSCKDISIALITSSLSVHCRKPDISHSFTKYWMKYDVLHPFTKYQMRYWINHRLLLCHTNFYHLILCYDNYQIQCYVTITVWSVIVKNIVYY